MIRKGFIKQRLGMEENFRWRGRDVERIEALSDTVFGFAVTLLVVSLEVPHTFDELLTTMRGFVPFAICFTVLMALWYGQFRYFRLYGLQSRRVVVLNLCLLFFVVFYVYPLKFVFSLAFDSVLGLNPMLPQSQPVIAANQAPLLFVIYGAGFVAVNLIFVLLYSEAYRKRTDLELNPLEILITIEGIASYTINMCFGLLSISAALIFSALSGPDAATNAWFVYLLITPAAVGVRRYFRRKQRRLSVEDKCHVPQGEDKSKTAAVKTIVPSETQADTAAQLALAVASVDKSVSTESSAAAAEKGSEPIN